MKNKKLMTKINFEFEIDDQIPELNIDMKLEPKKTNKVIKHKNKKIDTSTKLLF